MNRSAPLRSLLAAAAAAFSLMPPAPCQEGGDPPAKRLVISAASVHVGDGVVIEKGKIAIESGRISAVGAEIAAKDGDLVLEFPEGAATPGLIDANALIEPRSILPPPGRIGERAPPPPEELEPDPEDLVRAFFGAPRRERSSGAEALERPGAPAGPGTDTGTEDRGEPQPSSRRGESSHDHDVLCPVCTGHQDDPHAGLAAGVVNRVTSEQSSEIVPETRVLDAIDLESPDFERWTRGGVTTVYVSPDSSAVIGPRGAIVRTDVRAAPRVLKAEAAVKASLGTDPIRSGSFNRSPSRFSGGIDIYTRRPTTRMGVTWVFRKAFHDTIARGRGWPVRGADAPTPEASKVLERVLAGEVPLRVHARMAHDITTALRLAEEFQLRFTLEEATEAYRAIDLLRAARVPVILGPIEDVPSGERRFTGDELDRVRLSAMRSLLDAGIETALSARDLRDENGLARQAMMAIRFGVPPAAALKAVTATPARLLGIDSELGTLAPDKRADIVIWSGAPFAATSRVVLVLVDGKVVVDERL